MLVVVLTKQRRCLLCIYVISRRRRRRRRRKECQYWRPPAGHVMPCVENKIKYNHHHSTISVPILLPLSYSSCITLVVVWHSLFLARGDLLDVHSRFLSSFIIIFMFCCFPRNFWPVSFFTHKYPFGMTFISVIMLSLRCRSSSSSSSSSSLWIKTSLCVQVLQFSSVGKKETLIWNRPLLWLREEWGRGRLQSLEKTGFDNWVYHYNISRMIVFLSLSWRRVQ